MGDLQGLGGEPVRPGPGAEIGSKGSAGTPRPLAPPGSTTQVKGSSSLGTAALLFAREVPFLAEAHFEEQQEQGSRQAARDQNDGENFACHSRHQRRARGARDDQRRGGPEREQA